MQLLPRLGILHRALTILQGFGSWPSAEKWPNQRLQLAVRAVHPGRQGPCGGA